MTDAVNISPNTNNYYSGKGAIKIKRLGETVFRHMGDCPSFVLTPAITRLEHFASLGPYRYKDQSLIAQRQMTCAIVMDENTADNLALAFLTSAIAAGNPAADHYDYRMEIMAEAEIKAALRFVGNNAIGAALQIDLPLVTFAPGTAIALIQEQYGTLEITGEIVASGNPVSFGTAYWNITEEINP
jgi:hypothetical protein